MDMKRKSNINCGSFIGEFMRAVLHEENKSKRKKGKNTQDMPQLAYHRIKNLENILHRLIAVSAKRAS